MATASLYARNKFHAYGVHFLYFELGFKLIVWKRYIRD